MRLLRLTSLTGGAEDHKENRDITLSENMQSAPEEAEVKVLQLKAQQ